MKKVLLVLLSIMLYSISVEAQVGEQIDLTTQFIDGSPILPRPNHAPPLQPVIWQSNHQLQFDSNYSNYLLQLFDEDGELVYSTYVPAGTTVVYLPTTLSGEFEIRLVTSSFYFYGYITL